MTTDRRHFIQSLLGTAATAAMPPLLSTAVSTAEAAGPFPTQPVRLIVCTTPGTAMDIGARLVAKHLETVWNQPIVVLNQPGAGGLIGADNAARSRPDGHTILLAHEGVMVITPLIQNRATTGPRADLRAVTALIDTDILLITNRASGIRSIADLIAETRKRPKKMSYASAGPGTPVHLRMEMFKEAAGIDLLHVPYKGGGAALADLVGGHVDCTMAAVGPALPYMADKINVLASSGARRNAKLPNVPTFAETLPGYAFTTWFGMFAPADTPRDIVDQLSRDLSAAVQSAPVRTALLDQAINPLGGTPEQLDDIVRNDFAAYTRVLKSDKINLS